MNESKTGVVTGRTMGRYTVETPAGLAAMQSAVQRDTKELEGRLRGLPLNRHGKRAGRAIIRKFFREKAAARARYAARKANWASARIRPGDHKKLRELPAAVFIGPEVAGVE